MRLLDVKGLAVKIGTSTYVDHIDFHINPGECVALVGESGSGKSLTALSLIHPQGSVSGTVLFEGVDLLNQPPSLLQKLRREALGMVFQEPLTALNPLMKIGKQITEGGRTTHAKAVALLQKLGIDPPEKRMGQYPHELSGGQRQRVLLAMALAHSPKLLIADEPTTALDPSVQMKVMAFLKELQKEGLAILFISHDLPLVRQISQRIMVMYKGKVVEEASTPSLFTAPKHPYTQQLLQWSIS